jgi:hypothetical protein
VGRRGVNSSFKLLLPVFAIATHRGRGEGIRAVWLVPNPSTGKIILFLDFSLVFDRIDAEKGRGERGLWKKMDGDPLKFFF